MWRRELRCLGADIFAMGEGDNGYSDAGVLLDGMLNCKYPFLSELSAELGKKGGGIA